MACRRALITDNLFARERLGSTGLGHGVAIPHGRIKGLKAPMAALFQLAHPIGFDAPDELPVNLLIFLLVPEAATQKHLEILSEIAELLSDAPLRERRRPRPSCTADADCIEPIADPPPLQSVRPARASAPAAASAPSPQARETHRRQRRRPVRGPPRATASGNGSPGWAPPSGASTRSRCATPAPAPTWSAISTTSTPTGCRSSASARSPTSPTRPRRTAPAASRAS